MNVRFETNRPVQKVVTSLEMCPRILRAATTLPPPDSLSFVADNVSQMVTAKKVID